MNWEPPDVPVGFWRSRRKRDQIAYIPWILETAGEFQKNFYSCFTDYAKAFNCVDDSKMWEILKEMEITDLLSISWGICIRVKKQQLETVMEQLTGSKLGKEHDKAAYFHLSI